MSPVTIYEYAGGADAFQRLVAQFYEKVQRDPLIAPLFARFTDEHVRNVAIFLGEIFAGPRLYSEQHGGHRAVFGHHRGLGITEAQRARWADLMLATAREVLPPEPKLQQRFADYIDWGTHVALMAAQPDSVVGAGGPNPPMPYFPYWDWGPDGPPGAAPAAEVASVAASGSAAGPRFETDIRPLFREQDRAAMRWTFDLWSYHDVTRRADGILQQLASGTMPCDGAWPAEQVALFRRWVETGMRE